MYAMTQIHVHVNSIYLIHISGIERSLFIVTYIYIADSYCSDVTL